MEARLRTFKVAAMWIASLTGVICSMVMTIGGYLADWGPGSGMLPPVWRIWLVAVLSAVISAYVGAFLVRKLARLLLARNRSGLEVAMKFFLILLVSSMAAFIMSWEIVFLGGKLTGAIKGLGWVPVLLYAPMMSFIYGIPFSISTSIIFAAVVFISIRSGPFEPGHFE